MRNYSSKASEALAGSKVTVLSYGQQVLLKETDSRKAGCVDPYEAAYVNPDRPRLSGKPPETPQEIMAMYREIFGCHNYNLNEREIYTKYEELTVGGRTVGLWRYYLRRRSEQPRPCLVYIHGGGWRAGADDALYRKLSCVPGSSGIYSAERGCVYRDGEETAGPVMTRSKRERALKSYDSRRRI